MREQRWPGTLMAIGVVSLVIDTFTVVRWTLIEPDKLLRLLALLCFIGGLLPYRWVAYRWGMARLEWFLFGLLAVGPLLMGVLLWTNFLFHGPVTTAVRPVLEVGAGGAFRMHTFADGYWDAFPMARLLTRECSEAVGLMPRISTATGLLGVPVVVAIEPPA